MDVVIQANLMHDDLFHLDPRLFGCSSREQLASTTAYRRLILLGAPEEHARAVERTIFTTLAVTKPETAEDKVMRAADLAGLTLNYEEFKANTLRLWEEHNLLSLTKVSQEEFVRGTLNYLALYLWQDLSLSKEGFPKWIENWHRTALNNCESLAVEYLKADCCIFCRIEDDPSRSDWDGYEITERSFIVLQHPDPSLIEARLAHYRSQKLPCILFAVPSSCDLGDQ